MMPLKLKDLREDRDLKQQDVADFLNCRQQTYSRYEKGQAQPSLETLAKLALFFNTSTDFILGITNNPEPYARSKEFSAFKIK